ncbi:SPFH domain-containing protein [Heliophilum fasciatum]|uniref:Regulator of protease activity HflC (Stomatin/prohibitin superfamily) n=1 Tax=Heliophilum fasciatum TaxID=35700 RepID=A0A4V2SY06_9FIRM|nr:SPFH domain-containing protein [Heliophilum fasciatum]MCW2277158.1 regulator of protease activity HflC (stomatin/prohibitin superfamily) [Heliophilum fasciatum]TCP68206.1 regulator of protease activity HflC (stomatin/prohibitin superfamily) [Heliophilum fasciatum]
MNEQRAWQVNGLYALLLFIGLLALTLLLLVTGSIFSAVLVFLLTAILASGIKIVAPNEAKTLMFFGQYVGTLRESGIWLSVPFTVYRTVSLKVRNFNSAKLKVNDVEGNPIEIAAVIVFRVTDSAKAVFDVDNYESFVEIQAETALRHIATKYPYDDFSGKAYSLRGNTEVVASEIAQELQSRLSVAGVEVLEARLTHLAYATEIASAMLQRQQASAILAARQMIVEGAVGMAQMALEKIQRDGLVELDDERKVAMINNLLVSIVSDRSAQPVINTGSLY